MMTRPRLRKALFPLAALAAGLLAALVLTEAILHVVEWRLNQRGASIAHPAERSYWNLKPSDHHGFVFDSERESPWWDYTVNSLGFRAPELRPKPEGTLRVLALGDSTVFGFPAGDNGTWPALLEEELRGHLTEDARIEVWNFGIVGTTSHGNVQDLLEYGDQVEPDIIVASIGAWNDFQLSEMPDAELHEKRVLQNEIATARRWENVMLYQLWKQIAWNRRNAAGSNFQQESIDEGLYTPERAGETRRVPVDRFRENAEAICRWGEERGIPVFFATVTLKPEPDPANPEKTPENYPIQAYYQQVVREVAEECGAGLIPAAEALLAAAEETPPDELWADWVHVHEAGNAIVAETIAEAVLPALERAAARDFVPGETSD